MFLEPMLIQLHYSLQGHFFTKNKTFLIFGQFWKCFRAPEPLTAKAQKRGPQGTTGSLDDLGAPTGTENPGTQDHQGTLENFRAHLGLRRSCMSLKGTKGPHGAIFPKIDISGEDFLGPNLRD